MRGGWGGMVFGRVAVSSRALRAQGGRPRGAGAGGRLCGCGWVVVAVGRGRWAVYMAGAWPSAPVSSLRARQKPAGWGEEGGPGVRGPAPVPVVDPGLFFRRAGPKTRPDPPVDPHPRLTGPTCTRGPGPLHRRPVFGRAQRRKRSTAGHLPPPPRPARGAYPKTGPGPRSAWPAALGPQGPRRNLSPGQAPCRPTGPAGLRHRPPAAAPPPAARRTPRQGPSQAVGDGWGTQACGGVAGVVQDDFSRRVTSTTWCDRDPSGQAGTTR